MYINMFRFAEEPCRERLLLWRWAYANLHHDQTHNHASIPTLSFLQAGCPACHPTNSVKALKALLVTTNEFINTLPLCIIRFSGCEHVKPILFYCGTEQDWIKLDTLEYWIVGSHHVHWESSFWSVGSSLEQGQLKKPGVLSFAQHASTSVCFHIHNCGQAISIRPINQRKQINTAPYPVISDMNQKRKKSTH